MIAALELPSLAMLDDLELASRTDGGGDKQDATMEELVCVSTSITD
jgi:hypothetical protein